MQELIENVIYCGLNDEKREIFDELIPLEHGTTYNSYLIKGSEKVALIDTMYPPKIEEYIKNLKDYGVTRIDYIVNNHGEQDHTGALPALLEEFPEAMIVTNAKCKENIMEMLHVDESKIIVVKHNDEILLGDKTLRFMLAPGVHWPDTMFTHLVEDNLLFTCDFLGAHYPFEDAIAKPCKELELAAKRYYAEIMMPFRFVSKKYTAQVRELNPNMILPSHGPVYSGKDTDVILSLYEDWTSDIPKNEVIIPYVSMYKSVEEMVEYVAEKLRAKGIKVCLYDVIKDDLGDIAVGLVDSATIVLGASMVLANPHPAAANIAYIANLLNPKAKFASFIGSYGWGGDLFGKLGNMLSNLKVEVIEPVMSKGKPNNDDFANLDKMVNSIVEKHKTLGLL